MSYNGENCMLLGRPWNRRHYQEFHESFIPQENIDCCFECGQPLQEEDYEDRFHVPDKCQKCRESEEEE